MIKIKKILLTLLITIISSVSFVKADEYTEITENVEIRYKWYKEVIEGDYYPLKEELSGYLVDYNNYKYGDYSLWNKENCNLSDDYFSKEYRTFRTYQRIAKIRTVEFKNFIFNDNVKIYFKDNLINYDVISNENNNLKIQLSYDYMCDDLTFYIEDAQNYTIYLYPNKRFENAVLSKTIKNEKFFMPDKTWITENTKYIKYDGNYYYEITDLTTQIDEYEVCRYREKYVYKYQVKKEYYDDNYYLNVDGYIKDTSDYKIFYKGEPITNTIEITKEKIVKEPQIEYIYVPSENEIQKNDSSKEKDKTIKTNCTPKIKTEIIEKEIFQIPKKIYIIIALLLLVILFLIIKLSKKYVD